MVDEIPLPGGFANAGRVVRVGDTVRRPAEVSRPGVRSLLEHLAQAGFEAPRLVGVDEQGRESYRWIEGTADPEPLSSRIDALASLGTLIRGYHDAVASFGVPELGWSKELRDPVGGTIVCHNDICPENVVFRDGEAVALLDFDFAAPGRPVWDLAQAARMCVQLDLPPPERDERLRALVRGYGLGPGEREDLLDAIEAGQRQGIAFVRRRVERGERVFVEMWNSRGGEAGARAGIARIRARRAELRSALS